MESWNMKSLWMVDLKTSSQLFKYQTITVTWWIPLSFLFAGPNWLYTTKKSFAISKHVSIDRALRYLFFHHFIPVGVAVCSSILGHATSSSCMKWDYCRNKAIIYWKIILLKDKLQQYLYVWSDLIKFVFEFK